MSWDDFDLFCLVVERGGFTAAALACNRPKSSLSAAVARLETQLGTRLIERTTRRVRPTEAGLALYRDLSAPFAQLRRIASDALARSDRIEGRLRIASPYEFGAHYLAGPINRLMARHPELDIELDVEHAKVDLFDRHFDVVFSMTERSELAPGTVARLVFSLERGLYAAPSLIARMGQPACVADLASWPLLAAGNDAQWRFTSPDGTESLLPVRHARMRSANAETRLRAAEAGHGVVRITASFCEPSLRAGIVRRLLPEHRCTPIRVFALLPGNRLMPANVRALLQELSPLKPTPVD